MVDLFSTSSTLQECLEQSRILLVDTYDNEPTTSFSDSFWSSISSSHNHDFSTSIVDSLLQKICFLSSTNDSNGSNTSLSVDDTAAIRSIALFIRDMSLLNPNICHILLLHFPKLRDPLPFIELMPSMFAVSSNSLVDNCVNHLFSKLEASSDRSNLLLPIISALMSLPLSDKYKPQLSQLVKISMKIVNESDFPILFKVLLKSVDRINVDQVVLIFREEVTGEQ